METWRNSLGHSAPGQSYRGLKTHVIHPDSPPHLPGETPNSSSGWERVKERNKKENTFVLSPPHPSTLERALYPAAEGPGRSEHKSDHFTSLLKTLHQLPSTNPPHATLYSSFHTSVVQHFTPLLSWQTPMFLQTPVQNNTSLVKLSLAFSQLPTPQGRADAMTSSFCLVSA